MIRFLCWLKVNSIALKLQVSLALIDMEISHEEFNAIIREKQKYERIKENVRNVSEHSSAEKTRKYEIEQYKFKKNNQFVTNDFNWLKDV